MFGICLQVIVSKIKGYISAHQFKYPMSDTQFINSNSCLVSMKKRKNEDQSKQSIVKKRVFNKKIINCCIRLKDHSYRSFRLYCTKSKWARYHSRHPSRTLGHRPTSPFRRDTAISRHSCGWFAVTNSTCRRPLRPSSMSSPS